MKRSLPLLFCLCACAGPKQTPATTAPQASSASSQASQAPAKVVTVANDGLPEPTFVLLDEGQAPKTLLAMSPKVGERVQVRTESHSLASVFVGGQLVSKAPGPVAVTTVQAEVLAVSPKEVKVDWTSAHTVEPVEGGNPQEFERLKSKRDAQGSAHGKLTFNPRGQRLASAFDRGDKELIGWDANIIMAWPDRPVGPGARWETVFEGKIDGIDCVMTTQFTLLSVSEGKALMEINSVTRGKPGKLELEELPKEIDVELVSMEVILKGQLLRSVASFHQEQGELKGTRDLVMKLKSQGQEQEMRSQAEISSKISYGLPST